MSTDDKPNWNFEAQHVKELRDIANKLLTQRDRLVVERDELLKRIEEARADVREIRTRAETNLYFKVEADWVIARMDKLEKLLITTIERPDVGEMTFDEFQERANAQLAQSAAQARIKELEEKVESLKDALESATEVWDRE